MAILQDKLKAMEDDIFAEVKANEKTIVELKDKNWELRELAKHINRDRFNKELRKNTGGSSKKK